MAMEILGGESRLQTDTDDPGTRGLGYLAQIGAVHTCRAVYAGTETIREYGEKYLQPYPAETAEAYQARLAKAVLYPAFSRTVNGLTGMVFRKDPVLQDDVPVVIRGQEEDQEKNQAKTIGHWENIDLAGRHGSVFSRDVFTAKMIDGHTCILVDWMGPDGARTRAEEQGARPYWVHIQKAQVIRWRTESRGGAVVLISFAYIERDMIRSGEFGEEIIERIRQYDLVEEGVRYRSWTRTADSGEWELEDDSFLGERMDEIPVVVDYADRIDVLWSRPPLLDLAYENILHYQLRADRMNLLGVAHVPIFTVIGVPAEKVHKLTIGAGTGLVLEDPSATALWLEASGSALGQSRQELQDIEQRMASMGLAMLQRQSRAAETAEAKRIDKAESDSQLAAMARATADAIEDALRLHAKWLDVGDGGSVQVNTDYDVEPLDAGMVTAYATLVRSGLLSVETMWDALLQGNALPDGFNADLERVRLQESSVADVEAAVERIRQARGEAMTDEQVEEAA